MKAGDWRRTMFLPHHPHLSGLDSMGEERSYKGIARTIPPGVRAIPLYLGETRNLSLVAHSPVSAVRSSQSINCTFSPRSELGIVSGVRIRRHSFSTVQMRTDVIKLAATLMIDG
eukprot:scaffold1882_cov181-Skeletonema_marinoi.AAC.17